MKTIQAFWMKSEFDPTAGDCIGYMKEHKQCISFEVPDNATDEEIAEIAHRKDVIIEPT